MKDIKSFNAPKYSGYNSIKKGIYETGKGKNRIFVTSLSFVQEEKMGEGKNAGDISQYPLEDILDRFYCHVSDFYEELNTEESQTCYIEFASDALEDVENLRSIIGKHVYNKEVSGENGPVINLIIE